MLILIFAYKLGIEGAWKIYRITVVKRSVYPDNTKTCMKIHSTHSTEYGIVTVLKPAKTENRNVDDKN